MLTRVSLVLFLLLFGFVMVSGYPHIAGSCDSPSCGHHGHTPQLGDGGYKLEVENPREMYSPGQEVVLVLRKSEDSEPFEGFQIICETCDFPYIGRSVVAQINHQYCDLPGRVSHINARPKFRVEVNAKLPQDSSRDVAIEYYVVQYGKEWYGPMNLSIPMNTSSSSPFPSISPSTSPPPSPPSRCSCPSEYPDVCPSTSTSPSSSPSPSRSVKSEWSFETCQPPPKGSDKSTAKLSGYFTIYWSLHHVKAYECASVDILVVAKTDGWGSLGFTEKSGRMYPADAALGWIEEDGSDCHLEAYRIKGYDVHERDANASLLEMICISREDGLLYIGFNKRAQCGYVHIDLEKDVDIIYAIAKKNALVEHNKFDSATINFQSGKFHVTTYVKDYKAHGALMIIAWIVFVPLAILIARYRWSPPGIERIAWIDLHKWINYLVVLCVVVGLLVAIITFPPIVTKIGRLHRIIGSLISVLLGIQVLVAIFRPGPGEPWRPIFNVVHVWTGRGLFVLALVETFLGISAYNKVTGLSTVPWVVCVVLLLVIYAIIVILIETKLRWALYREGGGRYIGMTEIEYSYPEFDNDEE